VSSRVDLAAAYAECERMVRAHYENFPVASLLLPRAMRPHVAALYAFARTADDFADEGDRTPDERETLLNEMSAALQGNGDTRLCAASVEGRKMSVAVFAALQNTIEQCHLPVSLFEDLLSAFRQDVRVKRYQAWPDLLDYCRRSANPVGRIVLRIGGYDDPRLDRASDAVCTALQLTNFWQDLERDWEKERVYVPQNELRATGASEQDLADRRLTPEWRTTLSRVASRTRMFFDEGREIASLVSGRLRWELRLTWLGGVRILDRLERGNFDVFARRPTLSLADAPWIAWRALAWNG
jgi:squalene synthase HpnC